jgi:hypothetical protein
MGPAGQPAASAGSPPADSRTLPWARPAGVQALPACPWRATGSGSTLSSLTSASRPLSRPASRHLARSPQQGTPPRFPREAPCTLRAIAPTTAIDTPLHRPARTRRHLHACHQPQRREAWPTLRIRERRCAVEAVVRSRRPRWGEDPSIGALHSTRRPILAHSQRGTSSRVGGCSSSSALIGDDAPRALDRAEGRLKRCK